MPYVTEQCPRCFSTEGFIRREEIGKQLHLDGSNGTPVIKKKPIPVCRSCGRWSARKNIKKIFTY